MKQKKIILNKRNIDVDYLDFIENNKEYSSFLLRFADAFNERSTHIEFLRHINQMYNFDMNADVEVSGDSSISHFNMKDYLNILFLYSDLIHIPGSLYLLYKDKYESFLNKTVKNRIVDTLEIYNYALTDFNNAFKKGTCAYGANFMFVSLIEHELKLREKERYIKTVLLMAESLLQTNEIQFDVDDMKYYKAIYNLYLNNADFVKGDDVIKLDNTDFYHFICKHRKLYLKWGIEDSLFSNTLTMNKLLTCKKAIIYWDEDFICFMNKLFLRKGLNLRNSIAHIGESYYNYHSVFVTAVLREIFFLIISGFYLKSPINRIYLFGNDDLM